MRNVLFGCLSLIAVSAFSQQDFAFKVLVSKGKNEVRSSGDANWHDVRIGEALKPQDELKIEPNAYLGLMHVSGKPLELTTPGDYAVAELASRISDGASVLSKYTDFILSSADDKKNKLAATGAVHRETKAPITLYLPPPGIDSAYGDDITISWEKDDDLAPYHVSFTNLFGEELYAVDTDSARVEVNLGQGSMAQEETILVTVSSQTKKNKTSSTKDIKKLTPDVRQQITQMLNEFQGAVAENTALNEYVLGGFYEDRGLIIDALSAYARAAEMAPDVPEYQTNYLELLDRLNLKKLSNKDSK